MLLEGPGLTQGIVERHRQRGQRVKLLCYGRSGHGCNSSGGPRASLQERVSQPVSNAAGLGGHTSAQRNVASG